MPLMKAGRRSGVDRHHAGLSGAVGGLRFRRAESEGVRLRIEAQALALKFGDGPAAVVLAVDNLGVSDACERPGWCTSEKAGGVGSKTARDHVHAYAHRSDGAMGLRRLFWDADSAGASGHIDQYTRELTDKLEQVSLAALKDLKPAKLSWGVGQAELAINRRTKGGPVDHELPVLVVGAIRPTRSGRFMSPTPAIA